MGVDAALIGTQLLSTGMNVYSGIQAGKAEKKGLEYQSYLTEQERGGLAIDLKNRSEGFAIDFRNVVEGREIEKAQLWSQFLLDKSRVTKYQEADVGRKVSDTGARGVQLDLGEIASIDYEYELDKAVMFENLKLQKNAYDRATRLDKAALERTTRLEKEAFKRGDKQLASKASELKSAGSRALSTAKTTAVMQGFSGVARVGFGMYKPKSTLPSGKLSVPSLGTSYQRSGAANNFGVKLR